jgi:hypothetical protein
LSADPVQNVITNPAANAASYVGLTWHAGCIAAQVRRYH